MASEREFNGTPFDRYTLVHVLSGAAMGRLRLPLATTLGGAVLWRSRSAR